MEQKRMNFLTRLFVKKQQEEAVSAPAPVEERLIPTNAQSLPHTILRFTPVQESSCDDFEKQNLRIELQKLPPVGVGEVNFAPFEVGQYEGGYYLKTFIRNASDVTEEFTLESIRLALVDASGDKVADGWFKLSDFGSIKFGEARYWIFAWKSDQVLKANPDFSDFSVAFE